MLYVFKLPENIVQPSQNSDGLKLLNPGTLLSEL